MSKNNRIVITGIGLTAPNGNNLTEFRNNLLAGKSGVRAYKSKLMGDVLAGVCEFDQCKYQNKKDIRNGTRASSIGVYCTNEALLHAQLNVDVENKNKIGVYIGITDHGLCTTEQALLDHQENNNDFSYWSHTAGHKGIANNPAGEIALDLGTTGPHYTLGGACAAGNLAIIHGTQMLKLDEGVDVAIVGGVSEAIHTVTYFASFKTDVHPNRKNKINWEALILLGFSSFR